MYREVTMFEVGVRRGEPVCLLHVNATPRLSGATTQVPQEAVGDGQTPGGGVAMCQLEKDDGKGGIVVAEGLVRLQQAPPPAGDGSDRVLEGTLRLDYLRPSGSQ